MKLKLITFNIVCYVILFLSRLGSEVPKSQDIDKAQIEIKVKEATAEDLLDKNKKIKVKKTIDNHLNIILENYEKEYYLINNKTNINNIFSEKNTYQIIDKFKNKIIREVKNQLLIEKRINNIGLSRTNNIRKKIIILYKAIENIKKNKDNDFYEKLLYYTMNTKNENQVSQLTQDECEKITLLFDIIASFCKPYFFNIFFSKNNINNKSVMSNDYYYYLGKNKKALSTLISTYENIYDLVAKDIKKVLDMQSCNIKKILNSGINFFENFQKNQEFFKDINLKKEIIQKEIKENEDNIKKTSLKANGIIAMYEDRIKKKKRTIGLIEEIKKLLAQSLINKKEAENTKWYNIPKNIENIQKSKKIISRLNSLQLEPINIDEKLINNINEITNNTTKVIDALKELSKMLNRKNDIYSDAILNNIDQVNDAIENFKNSNDIIDQDKKKIEEIMSICEIIKLIKRPTLHLALSKNDKYCNDILFTIFFNENTSEEILKKILTILQYTKINMDHIEINEKNIFSTIIYMIKLHTKHMREIITDIEVLLLDINSYICFSILLQMLDPKVSIEDTFIDRLYKLTIDFNKEDRFSVNENFLNKITIDTNKQITLRGFGSFLFKKGRSLLQSIGSFFKQPFIKKNIKHMIENNKDSNPAVMKSAKESVDKEDDNTSTLSTKGSYDKEDNSDFFLEIHDIDSSILNPIKEEEFYDIVGEEKEEEFVDIDNNLYGQIT